MRLLIASKNRGKNRRDPGAPRLSLQKVVQVVTLAELPDVVQPRRAGGRSRRTPPEGAPLREGPQDPLHCG